MVVGMPSARSRAYLRGLTVVVLVLGLALCACSRTPRRVKTGDGDSELNQATLAKLQDYQACLDRSLRVFRVGDRYLERFGEKPPARDAVTPVQTVPDPVECIEAIASARTMEPPLPELEAAGQAYGRAISAVFALTMEGEVYYEQASSHYSPADAAILHSRLITAFREFAAAQRALFDQVFAVNRGVHLDQLARREQREGRTFAVIADDMMLRAEQLVQLAATTAWQSPDLPAVAVALDAFEQAFDELVAYAVANPKELQDINNVYLNVSRHTEAYRISAKQFIARSRAGVPLDNAEKIMIAANNEHAVVGSPGAVIAAYNQLVSAYSSL